MKKDKFYMDIAKRVAEESYCKRLKVGAVIIKDDSIISTGYNGTLRGAKNVCEDYILKIDDKIYTLSNEKDMNEIVKNAKIIFTDNIIIELFNETFFLNMKYYPSFVDIIKALFYEYGAPKTSDLTLHAEQNALIFALRHGVSTVGATIYITHSPCAHCAKLLYQAGIERIVYLEKYREADHLNELKKLGMKIEKLSQL